MLFIMQWQCLRAVRQKIEKMRGEFNPPCAVEATNATQLVIMSVAEQLFIGPISPIKRQKCPPPFLKLDILK